MRIAVRAFNDNPGSPVLVFGNALGTRMPLWTSVAARLTDDFQIYLTDLPGHTVPAGDSLAEAAAPVTIEQLASGVVESSPSSVWSPSSTAESRSQAPSV